MSNRSRTACSLAPAYFHQWRSKARISRSRSDNSPVACSRPVSAPSAPMTAPRHSMPLHASPFHAPYRSYNGVIMPRQRAVLPDTPLGEAGSGVQTAGPVRFGDPADPDHLRRGAQRDALLLRERRHLGIRVLEDLTHPVADLVLGPPVRL